MTATPRTPREEEILVLYGSQRGTTEAAAKEFCNQLPTQLSPSAIRLLADQSIREPEEDDHHEFHRTAEVVAKVKLMELDDFLENGDAKWTRLVVIFVSSFGAGHAPMGARKFRKLCDSWSKEFDEVPDKDKPLEGLSFALCGLGDSIYKTYQTNPNRVCKGLTSAGARLVGPQGAADASDHQENALGLWRDEIWKFLAQELVQESTSDEQLKAMQKATSAQVSTL